MPAKFAAPQKRIDRSALMLMLSYIEAECRNLGAADAARHVALAASLLPGPAVTLEEQDPLMVLLHYPQGNA
ncbi:hypothetical protein IBL26_10370 [Roseomonas aerophila]|uniref:Uncharacterized protein n=1 Tax=Teichococcus aerophilus TaxID=1224513 RepID=A0ABR7RKY3_9PROT|nr:hypothetical protein [Pseudoroseomonas aerophila]MBC9207240.1 hypothetical protein [Pseudoroseomonas aerophila]